MSKASGPKTLPTDASVADYLVSVCDDARLEEANQLIQCMEAATGARAQMWGSSIVGFGSYRYRYASGREGRWPRVGFSPRKRDWSVYIMSGFDDVADLLARLGPHRTGKSCLYARSIRALDPEVLRQLVVHSVKRMDARWPDT